MTIGRTLALAVGLAALLATAGPASAAPDVSGSTDIAEPNGFPGLCTAPCFTARKNFEVFLSGNPDAPGVCAAGENTYVYKVEHLGGSGPFIPRLTGFEQGVETDNIGSAGYISGFGTDPSNVDVNTVTDIVRWDFSVASGGMTTKLYVCSTLLPGSTTDTMVSVDGQLALDAPGTCVGPVVEAAGEPLPCTIGFWKNRYDGKKGLLKFFPDGDFDAVVTQAVALSGGIFADEAALLSDLSSKGSRPIDQRARQQLAAFLLNLAAGDLFPENGKCRLFEPNAISSNACGAGISVGTGLANFLASYGAGDFETAKDCADDTNNGIGVVGASQGE